jgi:hypothetical protein
MRVHHYDTRGLYLGSSDADPSPLEPGEFLIPARATSIEPPEFPDGKTALWDGAGWSLTNQRQTTPEDEAAFKLAQFLKDNPDVASLIDASTDAA